MKKSLKNVKLSDNLKKVYGFCGGGGGSSCGGAQYGYNYGLTQTGQRPLNCLLGSSHINGYSCSGNYITSRCGPGYNTTDY